MKIREFAPRLDEAGLAVGDDHRNHSPQPVRRRPEIDIEHRDVWRIAQREPRGAGGRLEAGAVLATHMYGIGSRGPQFRDDLGCDVDGAVDRIVEQLNREPVARPVERCRAAHRIRDDRALVIDGDLHEHMR